jgi:hypothetical protein
VQQYSVMSVDVAITFSPLNLLPSFLLINFSIFQFTTAGAGEFATTT